MKTEDEKEIIDENNNKCASDNKNTNMLGAAFIMFIFPIIAIFLGVFIGGYIGKSIEIYQIIGGIIGFALSMVIIKLFDKSIKIDEKAEEIHWDDL